MSWEKDISFLHIRATNSVVRITTSEAGYLMGSAKPPKLFAKAHERPVTARLRDTEHLSMELKSVGLVGKARDINFADEGVRRVLD